MRILWLTDIHLEFPDAQTLEYFYRKIGEAAADAVLISGDIGQAPTTFEFLRQLHNATRCPVYFVFGNHDYYYGSITSVRSQAGRLYASGPIRWLTGAGVVALTDTTCLIGHDGWGDSRNGDYDGSSVQLADFDLIEELTGLKQTTLREKLMSLGDEAAEHLRDVLPAALLKYNHIIMLTHIPPFPESAWWQGKHSGPDWLPFFSCKAMGDVLMEFMRKHPHRQMTVLCGHTHGGGTARLLPNLEAITGEARYGWPTIQNIFDCE